MAARRPARDRLGDQPARAADRRRCAPPTRSSRRPTFRPSGWRSRRVAAAAAASRSRRSSPTCRRLPSCRRRPRHRAGRGDQRRDDRAVRLCATDARPSRWSPTRCACCRTAAWTCSCSCSARPGDSSAAGEAWLDAAREARSRRTRRRSRARSPRSSSRMRWRVRRCSCSSIRWARTRARRRSLRRSPRAGRCVALDGPRRWRELADGGRGGDRRSRIRRRSPDALAGLLEDDASTASCSPRAGGRSPSRA